jgi:dihydroneopterin aldolase
VADRLLAQKGVAGVRVRCRKPRAVLPGPVGKVEIEIERS